MAQKTVTVCDKCGQADEPGRPVKLISLQGESNDWCCSCAVASVQAIFGEATQHAVSATTQMDVNITRKILLDKQHETPVYVISPAESVEPGKRLVYGNPPKQIEVIEPLVGVTGKWFAKVVV